MDEIEMVEQSKDPVRIKLDAARRELLDLSLRNKLLNYRPLKTKGAEIVDERPVEIIRILVDEGRSMSFLSMPGKQEGLQERLLQEDHPDIGQRLGQPGEGEDEIALRHTDSKLQTPYTSEALQKRLLSTYYAARTYVEEQGVSVLFLALGMLHWYESRSSEILRKAPLILIPVELSRSNVQSRFRIRYLEEDIGENLSLRAKLKSDFGITLPGFPREDEIDVSSYFRDVSQAFGSYRRWEVDTDAVALGFFSFGKFLMFNDLDSDQWPGASKPETHPVLSGLLHNGFAQAPSEFDGDNEIDDLISPDEMHHVLDADSSQTQAILDVNRGLNLIVQGPPGTGKSQTITNLVAEAIGNAKTVLFVSEKMAALEVVKRRLDEVGLGDACLELHSHKTKKRIVLTEIRRSLDLGQPKPGARVDTNELARHQTRLNGYSKAVNAEVGDSRLTPYEVYGRLIHIKETLSGKELPKLEIHGLDSWTGEETDRNLSLVQELEHFIDSRVGPPLDHPFWGSQLSSLLPADMERIRGQLSTAIQSLKRLMKSSRELSQLMLLTEAESRAQVGAILETLRFVLTAPNLEGVKVDSESWAAKKSVIGKVLEAGYRLKCLHDLHDSTLKATAWDEDVQGLRGLVNQYGSKWWRALSGNYRKAMRTLADLCAADLPKSVDHQLEILDAVIEVRRLSRVVEDFDEEARHLFGERWRGVASDWEELARITNWLARLHGKSNRGELPGQTVTFVANLPERSIMEQKTAQLARTFAAQGNAIQQALDGLELDESIRFGQDTRFVDLPFAQQERHLGEWLDALDRLHEIVVLSGLARRLEEIGLGSLVEAGYVWPHARRNLVDLLQHARLSALVERAWLERPILANFDGEIHERCVREFCQLDTSLLSRNRIRLAHDHWKALPKHRASGQLGVLHHEFAKKRRHRPIRKLMEEAGNVIQVIKPVFMMSPLSIAKFLPPGTVQFDIVVFDEASQVRPVDAFGAILRGSQLVVVGDDHQLPPTPFFDTEIDADDDYPESITVDLESILGLCRAQGMPRRMLRWHYRSQHESLITVSNYEFYDDKLVVFPSPEKDRRRLGLFYHYLPDTEYGRGKSRKNPGEARKVAEAVMGHARSSPHLTLGVAAFSISQRDAILDQLEILRRQDPSCEGFFRGHPEEPFFVKNLENVQGDERDVIFISVGYGRTSDGRVSMNFGPLNQEGGERRLNVLITRARMRCEVFTNLRADDIDLSRTKARGVQVLKRFLKYADTGYLDVPLPSQREPDSPFEEAVAEKLRQQGYPVEHQVGTGGFFIDLAIVDDSRPGRYLLGIECDGATYHSARSARDRDRLRQEVLENLGWQIHRIWSTDWYRSPEREMQRLARSIEAAKRRYMLRAQSDTQSTRDQAAQEPTIERHEPSRERRPVVDIGPYETAKLNLVLRGQALHEIPPPRMAAWIRDVVDTESPVHEDEVFRRIADCAGVKRIGRRIRAALEAGLAAASREGEVIKRGNFLWRPDMERAKLRSRSQLPGSSRRIRLIPQQEIALAVLAVVKSSYGISRELIPTEVCRLLGFKRTSRDREAAVDGVVRTLLRHGIILEDGRHVALPSD